MNNIQTHQGPPYDVILFDCDSTLCTIEGLDELARRSGLAERLKPVTDAAMNGSIDFAGAYAERLALLQPDQAAIDWLATQYQQNLTTGAVTLIQSLQQAGKQIHIVSGGILQAVMLLAAPLAIPVNHIHAVSLLIQSDGTYGGYDQDSPLAHQHGKAVVCEQLVSADQHAAFIGDGITDLEVHSQGIDFIGFGGVAKRPAIEARAAVYYHGADIAGLLPLLLTEPELQMSGNAT